ncbi:hypothetical protein GGR57DRAFT_171545 [Xylariaceae sp. FL1272]|nr:hypothetical protein GGR57DRAFT_171545 [Xylariaceae sp. FL1272]
MYSDTSQRGKPQPAPPEADNRRKRPRTGNEREDREEPPTAACDQCRLRKVRCDRLQPECSNCRKGGIECNSSNTLKRVNHMKQLRDDFSDVRKQLSDVDQTLAVLTDLTRQLTARSYSHTTPPYSPHHQHAISHDTILSKANEPLDFDQNSSQQTRAGSESTGGNRPLHETLELEQGGVRLYSYPAPLVLIKSVLHRANDLLHGPDDASDDDINSIGDGSLQHVAARTTLQQKIDEFPFSSRYREVTTEKDSSPVTTPPRLMVNLFVDGYLQNINMRTPIFEDDELHRAINAHYSDRQLQDSRAWALIMNNIVLLELSLEMQAARASHSTSRVTNDDILPSFLRNCDRAIGSLDAFMAPNMVNLQALLTLTLAAQEFYSNATAERVCHAACHVGRAMGLHRLRDAAKTEKSASIESSEKERRRLFRILYTLDKHRVFMTGHPCDLYSFDSDHHVGPNIHDKEDDDPVNNAFGHLMTIWEEIYLNLFTSRATSVSAEMRAHKVRAVISSLDGFAHMHAAALAASSSTAEEAADAKLLGMELMYAYQVSQILVLRCDETSDQSKEKARELARTSLKLLLEVCEPPLTTARFALLARMFRRYPMVAFVELVTLHLVNLPTKGHNDELTADIALLRAVCDQLATLQYHNLAHIFYARLNVGLVWALDTLESLAAALMEPSSQPQGRTMPQSAVTVSDQPLHTAQHAMGTITPDSSDIYISHAGSDSARYSHLKSFRHDEEDFVQMNRPSELTNFGFFTPDTDLVSAPLSPTCQPGPGPAFAAGPHQLDTGNWSDFQLDFLQGAFVQEDTRWD